MMRDRREHRRAPLYLAADPRQQQLIENAEIEHRLKNDLIAAIKALDAPQAAFRRFDLDVQT